jgi:hypothetical protein
MMTVMGIFHIKKIGTVVSGHSPWKDNLSYKIGDIVICGDKQWKVVGVDRFHQGCFGIPDVRYHGLKLEPIGHDEQPKENDVLITQIK